MIKTVKQLLIKNKDPFIDLLSHKATPLPWCQLRPGELLMERQVRTGLRQIREEMIPRHAHFQKTNEDYMTSKLKETTKVTNADH